MKLTCKEWVLTALLGTTAASALTTLILILVEATSVLLPADTKFGVVLDAGSSHTSLFVYRWPADKENDTGVVSQALACRVKGPGISSYASNPTQAGESLQGCLQEALAVVPAAQHQLTPLFLGATAGMRLLSQKNSSQAADIFAVVAQALGRAPLDFWGAELLPGQDEGAFGWITINYVLGLLVKSSPSRLVRHPCYHSGYQDTLSLAHLFQSPCVQATAPQHLPPNLTVEGTGNPRACVSAIRELFNFSSCKGRGDCAFNGVYQPPVRGQFYAFSSFYYTFHFLNLTSGQPLATANATIWEFCQKTWRQVEEASAGQDSQLRDYCASGLYILTLLLDGYGFSEDTWPSIEFRKQAGGTDIGWTLGYMLNLTNMIPAEVPAQWRAQSHGVWVASVTFVVLTLGAVLTAAWALLLWPWD
ncbi:ectonucleoside triphosphate diphosphohydrolase 8 isoform X3 [Desmodus rotundus]|uniref:ectonucleoside triphosphate diphosphohydrolase 8 isoform X3 n=1 Tax=Desmodus rotundus TaxID=9430 RepID=UPI0023818459|nr:ectonucleoside triphosphate diphosphohydrolase 8 isoform X3 [Desmodus rotundus]